MHGVSSAPSNGHLHLRQLPTALLWGEDFGCRRSISAEVARLGIEVQEPYGRQWLIAEEEQAEVGRAILHDLRNDPNLGGALWNLPLDTMSKWHERSRVKFRDRRNVMGYAWMKSTNRSSHSLQVVSHGMARGSHPAQEWENGLWDAATRKLFVGHDDIQRIWKHGRCLLR